MQGMVFVEYRREIDGLRAVAVLPVILFHAGFSVFSGGFVGVDVFFVVSGYLITSILIAELEQGNFSIARFYERRARRILPALFAVMLACLPFAYMWMLPSQLEDFSESLVTTVLSLSNIYFLSQVNYFAPDAELQPLLHTWSLAIEEQYYFLFPLMLLALRRFSLKTKAVCIFWLVVISFLFSEWAWRENSARSFFFTLSRFWEIGVGSICAFLAVGRAQRSSNVLSMAGLAMIVVSIFAYSDRIPSPSAYTLVPVVGTALIILFAAKETWVAQLLSLRGFVGIGLISYSAYLWHQPLFAFARLRSLTEPSYVLMAGLAVAALLLAWATWRYVEQPFRNRANPALVTQRSVFAVSGAVGAVFIALGLAGYVGKGFEWRFTPAENITGDYGHSEFHQLLDESFSDCEPEAIANSALYWDGYLRCKQTRPGKAEIILLGDSHAEHLFLGLAEELDKNNIAFLFKMDYHSCQIQILTLYLMSFQAEKVEGLF
jgi:peptidoglycan/LPS O-acetylase OafA/YrhL